MRPLLPAAAAFLLAVPALGGDRDFVLPSPSEFLKLSAEAEVPEVKEAAPAPFLMTELRMEAFKGSDSLKTRAKVETFVGSLGLTMTSYQDNEVARAIDVKAKDKDTGITAKARRYWLMRKVRAALKENPLVESARELGDGLSAVFKRPLYEEEIDTLSKSLPEGVAVSYYRNRAMKGIWINLAPLGDVPPKEQARALAAAHPNEISSCKAMIEIKMMEIRTGP